MDNINFEYINGPNPDTKYRRIIWMGLRNHTPGLEDSYYLGLKKTIKEDAEEVNVYPILLIWESVNSIDEKYAEITSNRKSKKVNRE